MGDLPNDLSQFRYFHTIEVRFADLDALEHVNHAKYFTYMETTRLNYSRDVLGWRGRRSELGMIIAQASCQYKLPLELGDDVRCYMRATRLGNKSFDFEYVLVRHSDGAVAAVGNTVQVTYDYQSQSSISLPDSWREAMLAYETALNA